MDRNEIIKKLPLDLTWRQAAKLIGDELVLPLWRASGVGLDDALNATDCVRLADAVVKSGKPPPNDEKNEWRHDRRKRRATEHVRSEEPGAPQKPTNKKEPDDTPEEALSDADPEIWNANIETLSRLPTAEELAAMSEEQLEDARTTAYRDSITYAQNAYKIPSLVADRRKKQYYNAQGQEEGSSVEEEDDPERSTSDAGNPDQERDCYKRYEDELTSAWRMK